MRLHFGLFTLFLALISISANAGTRTERTINDAWSFHREGEDTYSIVNIPHSWNTDDCTDDTPGFWRGAAWYERTAHINDCLDGKCVYVKFEGAYQTVELFVNGESAGIHKGGFTAFIFDITPFAKQGPNDFKIKVDNSHNPNIPPLSADFTFFGGIYRDVYLLITPDSHISTTHFATSGVYISTPFINQDKAEAEITTHLAVKTGVKFRLRQTILDSYGNVVSTVSRDVRAADHDNSDLAIVQKSSISNPEFWDIEQPRLYTVVTSLLDKSGNVIDEVSNTFGFRTFRFEPEKGFFLNGRHIKLMGTNRHQDFKEMANAIPDEMHVRDIRLLKDMGGNFLRISHYPQDPIITQMTDRLGILASIEIPIIDEITLTPEFTSNCVQMAEEMVWQNYNNPSVIVWGLMNEALIYSPWKYKGNSFSKEHYYSELCKTAKSMDSAVRSADPSRPTMIAIHDAGPKYKESGLMDIPDIVGVNLYCGWYKPGLETFGPKLKQMHELFAGKALFLTEYGADADPRLHSFVPESFDYTCEYGIKYHRAHIPVIMDTDYLAGSTVWNINDFHSEVRGFAVPHVNLKGLTGLTRAPKDTYWLYKATLACKPFIMIGDHGWTIRGGAQNASDKHCIQPVNVFSNAEVVTLLHNGKSLGVKNTECCMATFDVPFTDGVNTLEAISSDGEKDFSRIDFKLIPSDMSEVTELNVMLGSNRYFEDRDGGILWIPEQEYKPGGWGYVGGNQLRPSVSGNRVRPAMEGNVLGTEQDPIFQTQRVGIEEFRADVPDGRYYVYLYFAEMTISPNGAKIPYTLGEDPSVSRTEERVFDVAIGGNTVLKDFDLAKEYGPNRAVIKKFCVEVRDSRGIRIAFTPVKDMPTLSAVRIYKCD